MKLIRYGNPGQERPGLLLPDGRLIDASAFTPDYNEAFFAGDAIEGLREWVVRHADEAPGVDPGTRLGPPLARPSKLICIGLNYRDHAAETGAAIPAEPIVFFKATSAICGPHDPLIIPRGSGKTDWEVELAIVIGRKASYVAKDDALDHVAGYVLHNDYSERAFQLERGGQWVKGKSCDSFAPLGPFLATKDEIADVNALPMWLKVNGGIRQDGNTSNLIFDVPTIVSYLSQFMSLLPGDVISTGTPAGVGMGLNPQVFLKPGDVVELGIVGLGSSRQQVIPCP